MRASGSPEVLGMAIDHSGAKVSSETAVHAACEHVRRRAPTVRPDRCTRELEVERRLAETFSHVEPQEVIAVAPSRNDGGAVTEDHENVRVSLDPSLREHIAACVPE